MYLLMKDGSDNVIELTTARLLWMLGRHPACDLVLDDPGVSRFHATIFYVDEDLFVVDHSINGTHVPHSQEELDAVLSESLPLGTSAAPSGDDTQVIDPFEGVIEAGEVGPEDLHKSVTELRIAQSMTRVPRIPGYEAHRPTSKKTIEPVLQMIHSDTECHNLASLGRRLDSGASIVLVGRERHLFSIHGGDGG